MKSSGIVDKASSSCITRPGFKPVTEQGQLNLSSLEWLDRMRTKHAWGLNMADHLTKTYSAYILKPMVANTESWTLHALALHR